MKKIIPFTKEINFKSKIGEILSISLDHDIKIDENELLGNFFIKGAYKMTEASQIENEYSYKIPVEINISDEYNTSFATTDIDDFYYEIINDEILKVNISLLIDHLEQKEIIKEDNIAEPDINNILILNDNREIKQETEAKVTKEINKIIDVKKENNIRENIFNNNLNFEDTYSTYCVHLMQENETLENIIDKYKVSKEEILNYNSTDEIKTGYKLVIPSIKNE